MWQPAPVLALPEVLLSCLSVNHGVGSETFPNGVGEASTAWPTINRALYIPMYIERPGVVTKFWTLNGATAAGNIDIGLYTAALTRISSKGSTAQAGTNIIQEYDVTDFSIVPGVYLLGVVASLTTTTFLARANNISGYLGAAGIRQEDLGATTLPATATPVQIGSGVLLIPNAGIAFRTLVA